MTNLFIGRFITPCCEAPIVDIQIGQCGILSLLCCGETKTRLHEKRKYSKQYCIYCKAPSSYGHACTNDQCNLVGYNMANTLKYYLAITTPKIQREGARGLVYALWRAQEREPYVYLRKNTSTSHGGGLRVYLNVAELKEMNQLQNDLDDDDIGMHLLAGLRAI